MHPHRAPALSVTFLATLFASPLPLFAAQGLGPGFRPEKGQLPTVYPQSADVTLPEVLVHQDTHGGPDQGVLALAGGADGYAVVWRDQRYGNLGLMLGLLDPAGQSLGAETAVHEPKTSRQFDPDVALGGNFTGAVAWFATTGARQEATIRFFDGAEGYPTVPIPLGQATGRESGREAAPVTRTRGGGGTDRYDLRLASRHPAVAIDGRGAGLVVWSQEGEITGQRFERGADRADGLFDPVQRGEPEVLWVDGPLAVGSPTVAASLDGQLVVAWPLEDGAALWTEVAGQARRVTVPVSGSLELAADPGGAGFWLLGHGREGATLLALGPDLAAGTPHTVAPQEALSVDLALQPAGPALVIELPREGGGSAFELVRLDREGAPRAATLHLPGEQAVQPTAPKLAASGEGLLLAWNDRRDGDGDVYFALIGAEGAGPEQRWNTDRASSNQVAPAIASNGRDAGLVVWEDQRDGASRIFARRLGAGGAFAGDEFPVAADDGTGEQVRPAAAVAADGSSLVIYKGSVAGGQGAQLYGRAFAADGSPRGPARALDPEHTSAVPWAASVEARPAGAGFVVLFARDGLELRALAVDAEGAPEGEGSQVARVDGGQLRHPDLALLDDGRFIAVWDHKPAQGPVVLGGSFLGADLAPSGDPLAFPASPSGTGDWDPAVAPGPNGAFLLAWTGNDSPARDIFAAFFDRRGRTIGEPYAISVQANEQDYAEVLRLVDGSWVVVWEDDISYYDHIQARRIAADGRLGPPITVNGRATDYVEDRTSPGAAALGDGWLAVYSDRARSRGIDATLRGFGPRFDAQPPRAPRPAPR